jgi:hypothetical protein
MLILLRAKAGKSFTLIRYVWAIVIVMFSFVLVTIEIFECSGYCSTLKVK